PPAGAFARFPQGQSFARPERTLPDIAAGNPMADRPTPSSSRARLWQAAAVLPVFPEPPGKSRPPRPPPSPSAPCSTRATSPLPAESDSSWDTSSGIPLRTLSALFLAAALPTSRTFRCERHNPYGESVGTRRRPEGEHPIFRPGERAYGRNVLQAAPLHELDARFGKRQSRFEKDRRSRRGLGQVEREMGALHPLAVVEHPDLHGVCRKMSRRHLHLGRPDLTRLDLVQLAPVVDWPVHLRRLRPVHAAQILHHA